MHDMVANHVDGTAQVPQDGRQYLVHKGFSCDTVSQVVSTPFLLLDAGWEVNPPAHTLVYTPTSYEYTRLISPQHFFLRGPPVSQVL